MKNFSKLLNFRSSFYLTVLLLLLGSGSEAWSQITYYSKASATQFANTASWGTNADGTGTAPTSISNADNFIIANASVLSLNASAAVRSLTINAGSLSVAANTLTVSIASQFNSSLTLNSGGTLTVSGGAINVNGNMLVAGTSVFNQSGGTISIDGNLLISFL